MCLISSTFWHIICNEIFALRNVKFLDASEETIIRMSQLPGNAAGERAWRRHDGAIAQCLCVFSDQRGRRTTVYLTTYSTRPGYGNLLTRLLQLPTRKSAGLRHPAATAHLECCSQSRLQPSKVFTHHTLLRSLHWLPVAARIRF